MSGLAGHNHSRTDPATEAGPSSAGAPIGNLPNAVSLARLCAVPIVVLLALDHHLMATFVAFGIAGASDALDGWLARRYGGSALGAILDPLADKALLVAMFITLAWIGLLPVWLSVLAVTRDVLIMAAVTLLWARGNRPRMRPSTISKLNTALQLVLIAAALLLPSLGSAGNIALTILIWMVAATTALSAATYIRAAIR